MTLDTPSLARRDEHQHRRRPTTEAIASLHHLEEADVGRRRSIALRFARDRGTPVEDRTAQTVDQFRSYDEWEPGLAVVAGDTHENAEKEGRATRVFSGALMVAAMLLNLVMWAAIVYALVA